MTSTVDTPPTTALPVTLDLAGHHADAVRGWVEGVLGWQPVDASTSALVPPAVRLVDTATGDAPSPAIPTVLLVADGDAPASVARAGAAHRPAAVVEWPTGRDQLAVEVAQVLATPARPSDRMRALRVGGAAGGVGTTTVVLALAGLAAWRGARALAVVRDDVLAGEARRVPVTALGSPDLWERGSPLAGVPNARVVSVGRRDDAGDEPVVAGADAVVLDVGVATDVEVLVCRPDAAGLGGIAATTAAAIVVNGGGPVSLAALGRACGPRRAVMLPWSARVARAGLHGRLPAGLPGAWLQRLAALTPHGGRRREPVRSEELTA